METAALAATSALVSGGTTLIGTGLSVSGANAQARAATQGAALELQQYEAERGAQALAAQQQQSVVRDEMERSVAAGRALLGARGLDPYGSTGRALTDDAMAQAAADLETLRANAGATEARLRLGQRQTALRARAAKGQARDQIFGSVVGAFGALGRTGYGYLSSSTSSSVAGVDGGHMGTGGRTSE